MKATKEKLIECLKKIGWSTHDHGSEWIFIYNQKGKNTNWIIREDRVELGDYCGSFDESPSCAFKFENCFLQWLGDGKRKRQTICLTAKGTKKSVWIFFANYDIE